ncbi:MAG: hypothetical protein ACWA5K_06535 [bacterium]
MNSNVKKLTITSWVVTAVFVLSTVIPLALERFVMGDNWKSQFLAFQLEDENGQRHLGFFSLATILYDAEFMEYGYEAPEGTDFSKWEQEVVGVPRDEVKEIDGFIWADKGFLWADYKTINKVKLKEGLRQGGTEAPVTEQIELTRPGAPWDIESPTTSYLGKFPNYNIQYEDKNFKFDLHLTERTPRWYLYNDGEPFEAGDFGKGSMNELASNVTGTITHKQTGKTFNIVKGTALFEDAIGVPWSWIEWGAHDWMDHHYEGGWSGSLWKAQDDWQWGYNTKPHEGWLYDPEQEKFHKFERVDITDVEYVKEPISGLEYPLHATWVAHAAEGTLHVKTTNLTMKPRETLFPPFDFSLKMSYGNHVTEATFIRRNGEVVELGEGIATMEHFDNIFPDYVFWGPFMLVLLGLTWGGRAIVIRKAKGEPASGTYAVLIAYFLGVFFLYHHWMYYYL